ncbi:MAG: FAD dependent oxidoreductase TIGR03364 [Parvicella sp.]|jgi:FAD dependent oxidoreductase TIGR03364
MTKQAELAIVGGGILGLAHAYYAAMSGINTVIFERNSQANGASVRNFGMLIAAFQAEGREKQQAMSAEQTWQNLSRQTGFEMHRCGALLIAMSAIEKQVLMSYSANVDKEQTRWVEPSEFKQYSLLANPHHAIGALWVPQVAKLDQRQACIKLSNWLSEAKGVEFVYNASVESIDLPSVKTSKGEWQADRVIVCPGDDYSSLYPDAFADTGISRCQLQMLRTVAQPSEIQNEPFILGGLSYSRYSAFQSCDGIEALKQALQQQFAEHIKHGVHVIAAQESDGSVTVGDSHHYGDDIPEQRLEEVDELIIDYLQRLVNLPNPEIASRWLGHYASLTGQQKLHMQVDDNVDVITVTSGQGMTLGFSVASEHMTDLGLLSRPNNEYGG